MTGRHCGAAPAEPPDRHSGRALHDQPRGRWLVAGGRLEKIGRWVLGSASGPGGHPLRAEAGLEELYELEREFAEVSGGRRAYLYHIDVEGVRGQEREDVRCFYFADGFMVTDLEAAKRRLRQCIGAAREDRP